MEPRYPGDLSLRLTLPAVMFFLAVTAASAAAQEPGVSCDAPERCAELALEARAAGANERFHDLAWRAVQTGRPNDPDLMYLLARAQALSGRRRDALVMLRRLAEAGVPNDAATHEDFRRVRELAEWNFVRSLGERLQPAAPGPAASPARAAAPSPAPERADAVAAPAPGPPTPAPAVVAPEASAAREPAVPAPGRPATPESAAVPPAPAVSRETATAPSAPAVPRETAPPVPAVSPESAAARASAAASPGTVAAAAPPPVPPAVPAVEAPVERPAPRIERAFVEDAARFSTGAFAAAGLAYDAVSRRFLFGDMAGRRLFVVGEGADRTVDLVRAASAGFEDVTALAIDRARGDLWVLSSTSGSTAGAIHRLQLISGRAVAAIAVENRSAAVRLVDVAVAGDGLVAALDSGAPRLLLLRAGDTAIDSTIRLAVDDPTSVAVNDARIAYVAHREGILRIDLASGPTVRLGAATGVDLTGIEQIRWHRDALFVVQRQRDGQRWLARLSLGRGNRITGTTLLEPLPASGGTFMTIAGDELYYFVADSSGSPASGTTDVVVRRIRLRGNGTPPAR